MRAPFAETAIFFRPAPKSSGGVAGLPHLDQTSPPRHTTDPNQRPPRNLGNHHGGTDCNDSPRLPAMRSAKLGLLSRASSRSFCTAAVGACPPHNGVRRRWWITVSVKLGKARSEHNESAVPLIAEVIGSPSHFRLVPLAAIGKFTRSPRRQRRAVSAEYLHQAFSQS
jgi:hypothetical protein